MIKLAYLTLAGALAASAWSACDSAEVAVPARARTNLASLLSDEDYPAAARAAHEQGMVEFTLDVGPNGRVMGCTVTRGSGSALLDATTCRLVRSRARF